MRPAKASEVSPSAALKSRRAPSSTAARRTSYLIKRLETLIRVRVEADLRAYGLTNGQYMLLSLVAAEGGISSAELARRMSVTPQSMNESITALASKGLIRRTEDRANRRILQIALSPQGRRMLGICDRAVDRVEAELFAVLRPARLDELRNTLNRVLDAATERAESG
jgi:DNA-binding MarR family transcriptional regulator